MGLTTSILNRYLPSMLTSLAMTPKSEDTIRSILIVVMSEDDLKLCQLLHSQCWLDDFSVVPDVPLPENAHFPDWQPRSSARLGWRRVDYANAILSMGVGVFILDLDLLFYDNPFLLLQDPKYANLDFFSQSELGQSSSDAASSGDVNIGFSYFAAKNSTRQLISEWMRHRSVWDQGALQMLLRDKVVPELQWATLPSKVSHSLCHLRLGHKWDPNDKRQHQGHPLFQTQYYDHLVHNAEHYKGLITFHFPCCSGPLPHWVCKSLMMALALHARVDNEVSFINKISDTAANLFSG